MKKVEVKCVEGSVLSNFDRFGIHDLFYWCLNRKDVLLNGVRIKTDENLLGDEIVSFYFDEAKIFSKYFSIYYFDDNIVVVNKKAGIEVCDSNNNVLGMLRLVYGEVYAVHRIDRNTEGLVLFALNGEIKSLLEDCFKNKRAIEKYYIADVYSPIAKKDVRMIELAYSFDKQKQKAFVSPIKNKNETTCKTEIISCEKYGKFFRVKIKLVTGKTHQIRCVLAYLNSQIVGDGKYGRACKNQIMHLCSYKIVFRFENVNPLCYLNDKIFEVYPSF